MHINGPNLKYFKTDFDDFGNRNTLVAKIMKAHVFLLVFTSFMPPMMILYNRYYIEKLVSYYIKRLVRQKLLLRLTF